MSTGLPAAAAWSALAAFSAMSCAGPPAPANTGQSVAVAITANCTGPAVEIKIEPWRAELAAGDGVEWTLAGDADSFEITNRTSGRKWPFTEGPPYRGDKAAPKRVAGMKGNPAGEYRYAISLTCQSAGGQPRTVVIDPDMYVR